MNKQNIRTERTSKYFYLKYTYDFIHTWSVQSFPLTIPAKGQIFLIYIITSVQKIVHVQTDG